MRIDELRQCVLWLEAWASEAVWDLLSVQCPILNMVSVGRTMILENLLVFLFIVFVSFHLPGLGQALGVWC